MAAAVDVWSPGDLVLAAARYRSNADLIAAACQLGHLRDGWSTLDATYGEGTFWRRWRPAHLVKVDLCVPGPDVLAYDSRALPAEWADRFEAAVVDPDYGLRGTVNETNGGYGLDGGYKAIERRHADMRAMAAEAFRVARQRVLFKCMDQVASGRMWWQTTMVTVVAGGCGWVLVDRLDMLPRARGGRAQPERTRKARPGETHDGGGRVVSRQEHGRGRPSSLLIFGREHRCRT